MNRRTLEKLLTSEGVNSGSDSLSGDVPDECLCLLPELGGWSVFHSERGGRTGNTRFETEYEACDFMARLLLADPGNRTGRDLHRG